MTNLLNNSMGRPMLVYGTAQRKLDTSTYMWARAPTWGPVMCKPVQYKKYVGKILLPVTPAHL